jgi:hypothetical protein
MSTKPHTIDQANKRNIQNDTEEEINGFGAIILGLFLFLFMLWMLYVSAYGARLFLL